MGKRGREGCSRGGGGGATAYKIGQEEQCPQDAIRRRMWNQWSIRLASYNDPRKFIALGDGFDTL